MHSKRPARIAMIGYQFMGRAHSNAWRQLRHFFDPPREPVLQLVCGRDLDAVAEAARRLGFAEHSSDWRSAVTRPDIDVVDICTPGDSHHPIALAALAAGKAVLCEKPLANTLAEAREMRDASEANKARGGEVAAMLKEIAAVRDKVTGWRKKLYGALSIGWTGADSQWRHYSRGYVYLAALATPLVLSVHSVVSWDFAMSIVPGWHGTIFAPYFVAGAIYSGIGMVLTLVIPLRKVLKIEHMITEYHFDNLAKLTLLTGSILFYAYAMEYFVAWYSSNMFEQTTFWRRAFGPQWWAGWSMIICNAFVSQLLWFKKIRTNLTSLFIISIFINVGMWFERYVIIASSLSNDYLPYAWGQLNPTWADWGILIGSFGWFGMYFLLFARTFPVVAIQEIKEMIPMPRRSGGAH